MVDNSFTGYFYILNFFNNIIRGINMERMTLKTMSRSGIPNINNIVYSKDEFNKNGKEYKWYTN